MNTFIQIVDISCVIGVCFLPLALGYIGIKAWLLDKKNNK